jgi:hypothetical protein
MKVRQTLFCGCQNHHEAITQSLGAWFSKDELESQSYFRVLLGKGRVVAWGHPLPIITTLKNDAQVSAKHDLPQGSIRKLTLWCIPPPFKKFVNGN